MTADVTRQEDVDALMARTIEHYGGLDVLVNNAGRSARRAVLDTTPEDFRELMELNLISVVRLTRSAAPHLLKRQGHLVNIGSLSGKSPRDTWAPIQRRSSPWQPTRNNFVWNSARKACMCC